MNGLPRLMAVMCAVGLAVGIATVSFTGEAEGENAGPGLQAAEQVSENTADATPATGALGVTDADNDVDNGEALPAPLLSDLSAPSMCDGLSRKSSSGTASLLRARGLADQLPADVAAEVGSIRGFYCSTDVLAGKVAIIFIGEDQSGLALSNDPEFLDSTIATHREWADIPGDDSLISIIGRVNDDESNTSDNVDIESRLETANK